MKNISEDFFDKRVVLIGSFSGGNYGDTLVLFSLMSYLQQKGVRKIVIPAADPKATEVLIGEKFPLLDVVCLDINMKRTLGFRFFNRNLIKLLPETDYVIFTAGTIFFRDLFNPRTNFIFSVFLMLPYLRKFHVKLLGLFVGVNDSFEKLNFCKKGLAKRLFNSFNLIVTRDVFSYNNLKKNNLADNVHRAYDIALYSLVTKYKNEKAISRNNKSIIGFNICEYLGKQVGKDINIDNVIAFLGSVGNNFDSIYWFHTTKRDEWFVKEKICPFLKDDIISKSVHLSLYVDMELEDKYMDTSLFMGMRMHSLIPAIACRVPTVALNYNSKVRSLYRDLGGERAILELDDLSGLDIEYLKEVSFVVSDKNINEIRALVDEIKI